MATTENRSGFRLPWSSDRSNDVPPQEPADEPAGEAVAEQPAGDVVWPSSDLNARLGLHSQPRPADPADAAQGGAQADTEEPEMVSTEPVSPPAPVAPKKPSKLMADLSAAIRATAEAAREQALTQVDADVVAVVEQIRSGAKEGEDALRVKSDGDIAEIKEWSRAEIARIKEETEQRIDARRRGLDGELAAHAAAIETRVGEVEGALAAYRSDMDAYAARLGQEDDPARLATLAESMPEPPVLDAWADLGTLEVVPLAAVEVVEAAPDTEAAAEAEVVEAAPEAEAIAEAVAEETGARRRSGRRAPRRRGRARGRCRRLGCPRERRLRVGRGRDRLAPVVRSRPRARGRGRPAGRRRDRRRPPGR
jgi:hypothetical protein